MTWQAVILKIIFSLGGTTDTQAIYRELEKGKFITLTTEHLRATVYGGRPAYQHSTRSHIANLTKSGYLNRRSRGVYKLTDDGISHVKRLKGSSTF